MALGESARRSSRRRALKTRAIIGKQKLWNTRVYCHEVTGYRIMLCFAVVNVRIFGIALRTAIGKCLLFSKFASGNLHRRL